MSYIGTKYTRNNAVGKTIADIKTDVHGETCIVFTDGTMLKMYPHVVEVTKPTHRFSIICNAFEADGKTVIQAKGDE